MTTGIKSQIVTELQKAKQVGGTRVDKIRQIVQNAVTQTLSELKEGGGEIQTIAKESASTLFESLKDLPKTGTTSQPNTEFQPIEVKIETDEDTVMTTTNDNQYNNQSIDPNMPDRVAEGMPTEPILPEMPVTSTVTSIEGSDAATINNAPNSAATQESIAPNPVPRDAVSDDTVTVLELHPVGEANPPVEANLPPVDSAQPDGAPAESTSEIAEKVIALVRDLMNRAHSRLRQQEIYAELQQQLAKLKEQVGVIDTKLSSRYGDRYTQIKQDFQEDWQKTKGWYTDKKAKAQTEGVNWADQKQTAAHTKAGEAGATIAQKEQRIKQLLKELWLTIRS